MGGTEMEITEYVIALSLVASFKYLGKILSVSEDDFPAVVHNILSGASEVGVAVQGVEQVGCVCPDLGGGCMAVVQVVLLCGSETWMMTLHIGRVMRGFHQRVALRLMGQQPRRAQDVGWVYPLLVETMV